MKIFMSRYPKDFTKERKIEVRIDNYDLWNLDTSLALIITPALKKLKENKHGAPNVADEDVPDDLKSTAAPPKENEWDTDENYFKRWDWVLDEMIFAFESHTKDWEEQFYSGEPSMEFVDEDIDISTMTKEEIAEIKKEYPDLKVTKIKINPEKGFSIDYDGMNAYIARMVNGRRLFAKYYDGLWS